MYEHSHFFTCLIRCQKREFCKIVKEKKRTNNELYLNLFKFEEKKQLLNLNCLCITQNGAKANIIGYE